MPADAAHPAAAPTVPIAAAAAARVKTWYYYGLNDVNANVAPELMARYAEFVEDDGDAVKHATAFKRAGGKYAVSYTDPAYVPYCFPPFIGTQATCRGQVGKLIHDEGAWFHGRDGTRVRRYVDAHFGYQQALNPASPVARAAWRQTTEEIVRNGPIDLFYADDSGGPLHARDMSPQSSEFYDFNDAGVEITSDAVFRDQWIAYLSYAARPLIINGNDPTDGKPSYRGAFLRSPHVWGAAHEGCFRHDSGPVTSNADGAWEQQEDGLLANTALHKFAVCFVLGAPTPETRLYVTASWWLTYDPQWSVIAPIDPIPGESALLPELSIVPAYPVQTAVDSSRALHDSAGGYAREFRGCYQEGRPIGGCAATVNPGVAAVPLPALRERYSRRLELDRDDLLHGGRARWVRGIPDRIGPLSGAVLAR
ncbi:MAG: hypothetical protein JOZ24_00800 [Candidatus Eremiobacteraeota bacterium]|nr:hypothetical protein [Candidatus Eremiobacteraeota bacterium]